MDPVCRASSPLQRCTDATRVPIARYEALHCPLFFSFSLLCVADAIRIAHFNFNHRCCAYFGIEPRSQPDLPHGIVVGCILCILAVVCQGKRALSCQHFEASKSGTTSAYPLAGVHSVNACASAVPCFYLVQKTLLAMHCSLFLVLL